ncbi:hypothetical protein MW887_011430 [Aspergillus wentii]|nr:hypothetical protein MW887_011430 [Aspergillus wentii]
MIRGILGDGPLRLATLRRKENPWKVIVSSLAFLHDQGFAINWSEYHRDFNHTHRLLTLPSYCFDNKNYWMEYRNNWTLRKGDAVSTTGPVSQDQEPKKLSSSVHRVVEQHYDEPEPIVVFETELWDSQLHSAVSGHRVNGAALCPSSIYADIALTTAHHIQQENKSGISSPGPNVTDMEVVQPLIIKTPIEEETRVLRLVAHINRASQTVRVEYITLTADRKTTTKHAHCVVEYGSPDKWLGRWSHHLHLVQEHIDGLEKKATLGEVSKITSRLAYRLFSSLVDYAPQYQRMDQVLLASDLFEASATVNLDDRGDDASFHCSPYWIDALAHLSGFVMNGNETIDYNEAVYISHGWEGMRFAKPLVSGGHYTTYVRMLPSDKTMVGGDVWILHDGEIVGLIENLRFQRVPRSVLDMLLPPVAVNPVKRGPQKTRQPASPKPQISPKPSTSVQKPKDPFLDLIAVELGLSPSELSPGDHLGDLGVDSLMALTLVARLKEEFSIDISHSQFLECTTLSQLLTVLNPDHGLSDSVPSDAVITDHPIDRVIPYDDAWPSSGSSISEVVTPDSTPDDTADLVRSIIMQETGLATEDLEPSADLVSLGIDSLMSLTVLGKLREEGVELPMDFFLQNPTMNEVLGALVADNKHLQLEPVARKDYQARLVLLQRRSNQSSNKTLFLFPDGSGSPVSYGALEELHADFDVYGLVCPFLNSPNHYTTGIEGVVSEYLAILKKHSPRGPYHLGGWSVGGVLAYEASKQLIEAGDEVHTLVLIDAPCPTVLPPMSSSLIDFLNSIGVFDRSHPNSSELPDAKRQLVLDHFNATVKNLARYKPTRLASPPLRPLTTFVIWAKEGVCYAPDDPRLKANPSLATDATATWILNDRSDLGPRGWETLLPLKDIATKSVPGNHFTMMQTPNIGELSRQRQPRLEPPSGFWDISHAVDDIQHARGWLHGYLRSKGRYDGVMMFSRGCAVGSSILLHNERDSLNTPPPFKFTIFMNGTASDLEDVFGLSIEAQTKFLRRPRPMNGQSIISEDVFDETFPSLSETGLSRISTPTAHIVGSKDYIRVRESSLHIYVTPRNARYMTMEGHGTPRTATANIAMAAMVK